MSNELAKVEPAQVVAPSNATTLLNAIASAAANPAADIDKMERLFAMHEKMIHREAEMAFNGAFARAQSRMPIIAATSANSQTQSLYAKLAVIVDQITPIYTAEGFSVSFNNAESPVPGNIRVIATLSHPCGHSRNYQIDMPLDDVGIKGTANKTKVHATGATNSYARRYLTLMIWNLTTEDDNDAQRRKSRATPNAGAGDDITEEDRATIQRLADKVIEHLNSGAVVEAYAAIEKANMDVDTKRYLWSLLDSKQRAALKKEGERVRPIAAATLGVLQAKIGELSADIEEVQAHVLAKWKRGSLGELTNAEYTELVAELPDFAPASSAPLPLSSVESNPPAPSSQTEQAGGADSSVSQEMLSRGYPADCISADQVMTLETLLKDVGVTAYALNKAANVKGLYAIKAADYDRTLEWIDKKAQQMGAQLA